MNVIVAYFIVIFLLNTEFTDPKLFAMPSPARVRLCKYVTTCGEMTFLLCCHPQYHNRSYKTNKMIKDDEKN